MITIHLHNLQFHAFHGVHPEEAVLGNRFIVSMDVQTGIKENVLSVEDTVDYSAIYSIISKHMQQTVPLLEQLAANITEEVHALSNKILSSTITIRKMNAPIEKFQGEVGVSYSKSR